MRRAHLPHMYETLGSGGANKKAFVLSCRAPVIDAFFGYLFLTNPDQYAFRIQVLLIPAAQGGTEAPSRPAPGLGTSSVVAVKTVDPGTGWRAAEPAPPGTSCVQSPGGPRCSGKRQTSVMSLSTTNSGVKKDASCCLSHVARSSSSYLSFLYRKRLRQ